MTSTTNEINSPLLLTSFGKSIQKPFFVKSIKSFIFTGMAFTSYIYLLFVPLVLFCYYLTPSRFRWIILLVASYTFYMFYQPVFGLIILSSTSICWITSALIGKSTNPQKRKLLLILGICGDAGILFAFKYYNFFSGLIQHVRSNQSDMTFSAAAILLPVGISFYTFKSLGYLIDVYRKVTKPEPHFGYFALYVSFFPQLIAGPIERANQLIPQLHKKARIDFEDLQYGITRIIWGFFKKLVVADTVAVFVNYTLGDIAAANGCQLYVTLLFFAIQLYADFSGYCDIAIGTARLFGIVLSENFNQPYLSASIAEYWSRWHMTLTSWIRDYIFIPLNKGVTAYWKIYLNTIFIFILIGLWHGANINFILFGLINGILAVTQSIYKKIRFLPQFKSKAGRIFRIVWNFHLLILTGVVFRVKGFDDALLFYKKLFTDFHVGFQEMLNGFSGYDFLICMLVSIIFICSVWLPTNFRFKYQYTFICLALTLIILLGRNNSEAFIYFQF